MAKVAFSKLGLAKNTETISVQYGEHVIEILKYLDISTKASLVSAAVRGSVIKGIVDEILVDAYLHMFIVEYYTNITFTGKQKEAILNTFDIMESNGFFDLIISNMVPTEYEYIFSMAKKLTTSLNEYNRSIVSISETIDTLLDSYSGQTQ